VGQGRSVRKGKTTPRESGYIPPADPALFTLTKNELSRLAAGKGTKAQAARQELDRRRHNNLQKRRRARALRAQKKTSATRRRSKAVDYPGSGKPLAPTVLAGILQQPAGRFAPKLLRGVTLADLDIDRSERLPPGVRDRIAEEVTRRVRISWRKLGHVKPFAGLERVEVDRLRLGGRTRESLALVPQQFLSEMDLGALLELPKMDVSSLLDLLCAVEARHPDGEPPARTRTQRLKSSSERSPHSALGAPQLSATLRSILPLHWAGMKLDDLAPPARRLAVRPDASQDAILDALVSPESIEFGRGALVDDLRSGLGEKHSLRSVDVSLQRAGLLSERIPTLQAIADELGISRERVRQLQISEDDLVASIAPSGPLALSLSSWFAQNPKTPLTDGVLAKIAGSQANERASRLTLRALGYPHVHREVDLWTGSRSELQTLELVLDNLPSSIRDESSWDSVAEDLGRRFPELAKDLDLLATIRMVGRAMGFGTGPGGDLIPREAEVAKSLVRKIHTFLRARAAPIQATELAAVIRAGYWPFQNMRDTEIDPAWLVASAHRDPDLRVLPDGAIAMPEGAPDKPTGHVGVLYRIVVENGGPIRTQELCRRASEHGIDRNQVGMLIHSRRAPCLVPLARGVVGLVGRDEDVEPQHHPSRARRSALTPGDTPECFLFERGWAVRLEVDEALLGGGRWEVPPPLAEALGFRGGVLKQLAAADSADPAIVIDGKVWRTHAGSLESALKRVGAAEGDLVFVLLGADTYDVLLRPAQELDDDALTGLLWNCGLDPHDSAIRRHPWRPLAKVLGGSGSGRDEVTARLAKRGQRDLLQLLEAATRPNRARSAAVWPPKWFWTLPLADDGSSYAVVASDGSIRVAIGVAGPGTHIPAALLVTEGGLVWNEHGAGGAEAALERLPADIVPAGSNSNWVRWTRAEHGARLAALAGTGWEILVDGTGWHLGGERFASFLEALEGVGSNLRVEVTPSGRSGRFYPRSALAFERAVRSAVARGLRAVSGESTEGFVATFDSGTTDNGLTLLDALDARGTE
jgi:hypothetical protein